MADLELWKVYEFDMNYVGEVWLSSTVTDAEAIRLVRSHFRVIAPIIERIGRLPEQGDE